MAIPQNDKVFSTAKSSCGQSVMERCQVSLDCNMIHLYQGKEEVLGFKYLGIFFIKYHSQDAQHYLNKTIQIQTNQRKFRIHNDSLHARNNFKPHTKVHVC